MKTGIAIFVKTPGYSPVKSRLAQDCGQSCAEQWYDYAVKAVASIVQTMSDRGIAQAYWVIAEAAADTFSAWQSMPRLIQVQEDLGTRMAHVHNELITRHGAGILLGADTPQLSSDDLEQAITWLQSSKPRWVVAPARDGGFWLFGANRSPSIEQWQAVPYSHECTYASLLQLFEGLGELKTLRMRTDVDHAVDVPHCIAELEENIVRSFEQNMLLAWMKSNCPFGASKS